MSQEGRNYNLRIWRQKNRTSQGKLVDYKIENIARLCPRNAGPAE